MTAEKRRPGLAVVTGASSGIGFEIARQLAMQGHPVLAVARRRERLEALAAAVRDRGGAPVHPFACDLTDPSTAIAVRDRARDLGGAAWLVNDAGTVRYGPFASADSHHHLGQVRLNVEALVALCAAFLPDLRTHAPAVIVNLASMAAFQPTPYMAVYGATKAFVLSYSEALSEELRGAGVTVTAVCPGPVTTELFGVGAPGVVRHATPLDWTAEACARFAIAAARRGDVVAIPGAMNGWTAAVSRLAPRSWARYVSARVGLRFIGLEAVLTGTPTVRPEGSHPRPRTQD